MIKFKCRKDKLFKGVYYAGVLLNFIPIILTFFIPLSEGVAFWGIVGTGVLCFLVNIWLIWVFVSSNYAIDQEYMHYQFGPHKGKISLQDIKEVKVGETQWAGMKKYALAQNGLIIKYEKYRDIYISPITNESFVEELLKVNDDIKIVA